MTLGEKILNLRKKNGLSQEELGEKINVTRQTISNWELGETSPNVEQLKLLSKELNVSIDELLDNDIQNVVVEKVSNTEKLAGLILKIIKTAAIMLIIGLVLIVILFILLRVNRSMKDTGREIDESIFCNLYGEEHGYNIVYQELTGYPIGEGGDSYFYDILDLGKYDDAHQIFNVINDYVKKNGGTCQMIYDRDLNDIVDIQIKNLTNTSMKLIIKEKSPNKIVYGQDFYIEKYVNNNWKSVKEIGENYGFNDMAYYTNKNGILEMNQDWTHIYGKLPIGIYRIVKNVSFESPNLPVNGEEKFYIWQEFEIK